MKQQLAGLRASGEPELLCTMLARCSQRTAGPLQQPPPRRAPTWAVSWAPPAQMHRLWTDRQKPSSRQYASFPPRKNKSQLRYLWGSVVVRWRNGIRL